MNDAAQRPVDKLARGTAVGLAGYCTFINLYSPQSLLPSWAAEFSVSAAAISATMTAGTLAVALTAPFSGAAADVLGRKRVITAAMAALVVSDADDRVRVRRAVADLLALRPGAGAAVDLRGDHRLYRRRVAGGGGRRHGRHLHLRREPRRIQRTVRHRRAGRSDRLARRLCGAGPDHARGRLSRSRRCCRASATSCARKASPRR